MSVLGVLRPVGEGDLAAMLSWRNAPAVRKNMYNRHEISLDEHLAWWAKICGSDRHAYLVYELAGSALGIVAFSNIDPRNRNAEWAFYAAPDAPKGVGSRMEFLALEHAFSSLALHKLRCEVLDFNVPVIRLHEKFGFKTEGVFRDEHMVDGTFVAVHRLGMLATEWQQCRQVMLDKLCSKDRG